jgi:UDP-N-acetylglucosamine:LPS N-acetylglucosamine transferase
MTKLLILSSDTGEGHNSAAAAIAATAQAAGMDPTIRKPLEESGPFNRALGNFYNLLLTRKPQWMTHYLWLIDRIRPNDRTSMYPLVKRFIADFIDSARPDVVLSVHPMLNHYIPRFIKEERLAIPFYTFVTDPFPPFWRGWASPFVDRYFVVRDEAFHALTGMGVPPSHIEIISMPVRPQFRPANARELENFRNELNIGDDGIVLINGGARGGGPIYQIYQRVKKAAGRTNIVVICGRNSTLQARIDSADHFATRTVGFVPDIHRYVAAADLVLTKPGAMSTYETLACGVPVVLLGILALMPQESGIFDAAKRYDFGFSAQSFNELEDVILLGRAEWNRKREKVPLFYRNSSGEDLIERIHAVHARV